MLFVCDMHIHIGSAGNRQAVKVTASKDLTFANIAKEAAERKGIDVVGIIDCASPRVIADIEAMMQAGEMLALDGGGLRYRDAVTVILGSEIETREPGGGMSHHCSYFPDVAALKAFSAIMEQYITNVNLSSQACGLSAADVRIAGLRGAPGAGPLLPHTRAHTARVSSGWRRCSATLGRIPNWAVGGYRRSDTGFSDRAYYRTRCSQRRRSGEYNILQMSRHRSRSSRLCGGRPAGVPANFGLDPRLGNTT